MGQGQGKGCIYTHPGVGPYLGPSVSLFMFNQGKLKETDLGCAYNVLPINILATNY